MTDYLDDIPENNTCWFHPDRIIS